MITTLDRPAEAAPTTKYSPRVKGTTYRDGRGMYHWKGEKFPSVTTVLGALNKPALTYWAAKVVAERVREIALLVESKDLKGSDALRLLKDTETLKKAPWEKRDAKRDIGTTVHDVAEMLACGTTVDPSIFADDVQPYVRSFVRWFEATRPDYDFIEAGVFNRKAGYAGTMDSVMTVHGRRLVVDYKTSSDTYPEHALQLAAYRFAEFLGMPDGSEVPMPQTDGGAILVIGEEDCRLVEWDCGAQEFAVFLSARAAHVWTKSKPEPKEMGTCQSTIFN